MSKRRRVELECVSSSTLCQLHSRDNLEVPYFWRHAAESAGVSDTDAFLIHLGRSIAAAIQSTGAAAEAARSQLRDSRSALHSAIVARCDELAAKIDSTESSKVASLERELVAVDAALEHWRANSAFLRGELCRLPATEAGTPHKDLSSLLSGIEAQLRPLPTAVVEPPTVALLADARALFRSISCFGRVLVPQAVAGQSCATSPVPGCPP